MELTVVTLNARLCPFCVRLKAVLARKDIEFVEVDESTVPDLLERTSYRTFPMVFLHESISGVEAIDDKNLIGGYTEVSAMIYEGRLR